jgi:hypothetical protein
MKWVNQCFQKLKVFYILEAAVRIEILKISRNFGDIRDMPVIVEDDKFKIIKNL